MDLFEIYVKGTSHGKASFEECADYAYHLVYTTRRFTPDDIVIINARTGEIVPS